MSAEAAQHVAVRAAAPAATVVLVPFPAQVHISPMLHLARALAARGVAAIVAVPDFVYRRLLVSDDDDACGDQVGVVAGGVELASIDSDVPDDGLGEPPGFAGFARAMEHHMPTSLEAMLTARRGGLAGCGGVACLVADVLASWAVPVATRCGVPAVGFWPAMLATYRVVAAIPELIDKGLISDHGIPIPTKRLNIGEGGKVNGDHHQTGDDTNLHVLPAQVGLSTAELPWLVGDAACQKSRFTFWLRTMERAKSLRSILVNTFPVVEPAGVGAGDDDTGTASQVLLQIGPLLTPDGCISITKGDALPHDSPPPAAPRRRRRRSGENPSMWPADETCVEWLDAQRVGSVIYVSFGSWVASIGRDAIRELALGLEATARPFLWALKDEPSWREGLPSQFASGAGGAGGGRGKIVAWAPQEEVLRHGAVGCYLTHCGWNLTLEAIRHGVRLLCYPVSGDQFINCAHIVRVWGTGIRLGSAERSVVVDCVERIMGGGGEEGRRLQEKVDELRKRVMMGEARRAANGNLDSFVHGIMRIGHLLAQPSPSPLTCARSCMT